MTRGATDDRADRGARAHDHPVRSLEERSRAHQKQNALIRENSLATRSTLNGYRAVEGDSTNRTSSVDSLDAMQGITAAASVLSPEEVQLSRGAHDLMNGVRELARGNIGAGLRKFTVGLNEVTGALIQGIDGLDTGARTKD